MKFKTRDFAFKATTAPEGKFSGYGSVFGNVDSYGDIVAPGAFAESLGRIKASGDPLPVLWQHDSRQPIGGYDMLAEDANGLKVEGFLMTDEIPLAKQAYELLSRRVVKGLSIGFYTEASSYNDKTGIYTLTKLDLREISIVTFPANELAQVEGVKQLVHDGKLPSVREFEEFLRDAGFSRKQASEIASRGLKQADQRDSDADILAAILSIKL